MKNGYRSLSLEKRGKRLLTCLKDLGIDRGPGKKKTTSKNQPDVIHERSGQSMMLTPSFEAVFVEKVKIGLHEEKGQKTQEHDRKCGRVSVGSRRKSRTKAKFFSWKNDSSTYLHEGERLT